SKRGATSVPPASKSLTALATYPSGKPLRLTLIQRADRRQGAARSLVAVDPRDLPGLVGLPSRQLATELASGSPSGCTILLIAVAWSQLEQSLLAPAFLGIGVVVGESAAGATNREARISPRFLAR